MQDVIFSYQMFGRLIIIRRSLSFNIQYFLVYLTIRSQYWFFLVEEALNQYGENL